MFYATSSPARRRTYRFGSAGPRSPYCKRRINRRRHAIHSSDSTSSSSSDDEQHFERRLNRSRNKAINRCLPMNFLRDDLKGVHKDRMKIGASLADVDPMQIDTSVRFSSVGGLSAHIASLKEMVVFPLLYPEIFEKFKIQPPRGCLFYGPPGTGKTLVARALANECRVGDRRVAFFMRKGADCLSKWVGESERQLRLLFDQVIFALWVLGMDAVFSIVSTLLALMDGLDSRGEIVVIGATNRLDSIDPALRRPGRFDREFLFSLPNREARLEILKIHTKEWNPKPSEEFLQELAEKCVGYCGADIKSVCAEAALCALRRRYPQIYTTSEKLLLDITSIKITAKDFILAMQKIVPASQRAVVSPGQALSSIIQPLLQNTLKNILVALGKVFPHADEGLKNKESASSNQWLDEDLLYSDDEQHSMFENGIVHKLPNNQKENRPFLHFSVSANQRPTSYRPRILLSGSPGLGQGTHLAPAVIHALEKFTVYTLDLAVLFGVSVVSPEENCAQLFREAKRTAPSILYIPHIHLWWETVGCTLKATFITLLKNIPSFSPILLLATCDVSYAELPSEVPDYVTVIAQPMDLSTVISKIDLHKYQTVEEYLKDIDLICSNALEYNPDKDPGDRLIRHRACTLRDATYAIIKQELDEEFEKLCEEIQESRKKRSFSSSKYIPSYYHVLPKNVSVQDGKKTDVEVTEKLSGSALPIAASTPSTGKKRYRRKSRWSSGVCGIKRKRVSRPDKHDEEPASDADHELPESSLDQTELELNSCAEAEFSESPSDPDVED
ncbi:hypothetical protein GDO78_012370 [Eleutherodactylus coqui]|nr:hypothetical protein GDO78_012370 [Eleutherodactylus coqui]